VRHRCQQRIPKALRLGADTGLLGLVARPRALDGKRHLVDEGRAGERAGILKMPAVGADAHHAERSAVPNEGQTPYAPMPVYQYRARLAVLVSTGSANLVLPTGSAP
jgi:hypothetical protein